MKNWKWGAEFAAAAAMWVGVSTAAWGAGSGVLTGLSGSGSYAVAGCVNPGNRMTLEAWVKPTGWRSYSGREKHGVNFMYKGLLGSHCDYVFCLQEDGIPCLGNTHGYYGVLGKRVPLNQWTHLAVTLDNGTGDMRFYINGEYAGAGSGWQGFKGSKKGFLSPSGHDLMLGGFYQRGWGYNNDNFIGELADVRVWSVVRSAAEIAGWKDRELTGKESGLLAYWTFADGKDRSGHGWNLVFNGGCRVAAGRGPTMWGRGVTAELKDPVNGAMAATGTPFRMRAKGKNEAGWIGGVTFKVNGEAVRGVLDRNETEWAAHADWTPKRPGWYQVSAEAINTGISAKGTSKTAYMGVKGPWNGTTVALPGRVEAENFDIGGEGKTWHDTTSDNTDKGYRTHEGVDISSGSTGYAVSSTKAGEWMEYSVNGGNGGTWVLTVKSSAQGSGGRYRVLMDGKAATEDLPVPDTGSWSAYTVGKHKITVPKGAKKMRVEMRGNGSSGCVGNFDYFQFEKGTLELAADRRELGPEQQKTKEFKVKANHPWTATTGAGWLTVKKGSGTGDGVVTYDVAANSGAARTGTIRVKGIGVERTYTVTQKAGEKPKLELGGTGRTLGTAAQGGKELAVKGNVDWTAASDAGWLTLKTKSGKGNGTVTYSVKENTGPERRAGITVCGGGLERVYEIAQKGAVAPKLELGGAGRDLGAAAQGGKEFAVKGNVEWTVQGDAAWILLKTVSGSGDGKVAYGVQKNAGKARTGWITVSGGGLERRYEVRQEGEAGPALELGGDSRTFGAGEQKSKQFSVKAGGDWTVGRDVGWITLRTVRGTGAGVVYYDVAKNEGAARQGRISVTAGGTTRTYTVTQTKAGSAPLELGGTSRELGSDAQRSKELKVKCEGTWTASSDSSWLRLRTAGGKGDGVLSYDVDANGGGTRSGRIAVSGCGMTEGYVVTQAGVPAKKAVKRKQRSWSEEDGWVRPVAVLASDKSDARAVADGDEQTWWSPQAFGGGAWVALTYDECFLLTELALVLESEETPVSVLVSEDAVDWREVELPLEDWVEDVQYLWVLFPESEEVPVIREIGTRE